MFAQIPLDMMMLLMLYAAGATTALIACLYLLFRRCNAFAPRIRTSKRLRLWTGTFYGSGADNAVATALGTVTVDGISGWEVPDRDQASLIFNARGSIGGLNHNSYLCLNNGYKCFFVGGGATAFTPTYTPNNQTDTALRPVATVTIAKE